MDEDARDLRIGCGALDQLRMQRRPFGHVDGEGILEHGHRGHVLALLRGEDAIGHGGEPDIGVEPDLMARMAGDHRAAARLRHVAHEQPRPAVKRPRVAGQPLEIIEQLRRAPIAIAREPHHLPVRAVDGQRDAAGHAPSGIGADGAGGERRWRRHGAEEFLGGRSLGFGRLGGGLFGGIGRPPAASRRALGGLTCSAATAPQKSTSMRHKTSLRMDLVPIPSPRRQA